MKSSDNVVVVFRSRIRADADLQALEAAGMRMYELASAMPGFISYKDFEESDLLIFVGANPVIAHPVMWNRVKMNTKSPKIVVIDPRRTKTARSVQMESW